MIIDAHAHLVAPDPLYSHRSSLIVTGGQEGDSFRATLTDADLEKSAANNVAIMDKVGTDVQLLSPRPYLLLHGSARWPEIVSWCKDNNDAIARTVKLRPTPVSRGPDLCRSTSGEPGD